MKSPRTTASIAAALALLLVSAGRAPSPPVGRGSSPAAAPAHVVVILMENKEFNDIIDSGKAPFLNAFARRNVLLEHEFAVTHPSEPNYLALTSGRTFGSTTDCGACTFAGLNIADQLAKHHMGWKAYMQGVPSPCFKGDRAGVWPYMYSSGHNPFIHYKDIRSAPSRCAHIVPFSELQSDLDLGSLPRYAFISPNECNDMHSCAVGVGDRWLRRWIPRIMPKLGANGLLILTFDEGSTLRGCCGPAIHGGHVVTVIAGPGAANGVQIVRRVDHYSILGLIDDALGFQRLGHAAAANTPSIPRWQTPTP